MKSIRAIASLVVIVAAALLLVLTVSVEPAKWTGALTRAGAPQAPHAVVDTMFPAVHGRTIHVAEGGDLQKALNEAKPGDQITLQPKATYRGPFQLPLTTGNGWIVVTAAPSSPGLPPEGQRVTPSNAGAMPKLVARGGPVIEAGRGVHHVRFVGLEIAPEDGAFLNPVVQLGKNDTQLETLPHHIVFDRCYLHGDAKQGSRRGIAMNSRDTAVVDSYLSDFKEVGADSQAIASWNGAGPFRITNSYLEAAGENIMFGGGDPTIRDLVPSDVEIRRNELVKPLRWKIGDPSFEGTEWAVKNLFELKNARRVVIEGNLFEYNWPHAQNGFAILFTVRNQDGRAPWSTVEDVVFENNVVRHVASGVNILGHDDNHPSERLRRLAIRNNLFLDVGGSWGNGRLFQLLDGTGDIVIEHNTALQTGGMLFGGDSAAHTGFVFENNIAFDNRSGISGSGSAVGMPALNRYFPASIVRRNVIVGGSAPHYPPDNFFPAAIEEVGFAGYREGRFHLASRSPYARAATDGRDPGADIAMPRASGGAADAGSSSAALAFPGPAGLADSRSPDGPAAVIFWIALALLGYVYLGYPILAGLSSMVRPRTHHKEPIEPKVSVVVVAHNEAGRIAARIENLLTLDYPPDRLEIIIGSDGSTDDTVDRAREYADRGVIVRAFRERRGKPALLNTLVPHVKGDIVVLADARQRFEPGAIRALVANFADRAVGAVSGELMLEAEPDAGCATHGTALYWRYEKFIRSVESRADSTIGATGAIYAIRRTLFEPVPEDTILDDVVIPLRIAKRGYRLLFEPHARAFDRASATAGQEFARKTRTIAGTFQLFARERWLFHPIRNRLWLQTISHKGLRLTLPGLHVALFAANLTLVDLPIYPWTMALQVVFYAGALFGCAGYGVGRRPRIVSVPHTICLLSWATIVGFLRMVTHSQPVTWERSAPTPTARPFFDSL